MARRIEHRTSTPWDADRVHAALVDPAFLRDRLAALGGPGAELVEHRVDDGAVTVRLRHGIPPEEVPAAVRPFLGSGLKLERIETWHGDGPGRYSGTVRLDTSGLPGEIAGATAVQNLPAGGSELSVDGEVKVSIPLVGGKIEDIVAEQVRKLLAREADFALEWIAEHAG
ncbi:DUF2505 domain-containing protein [Gandjariella thermophila]|uniref:DUF2505 domain-containing protein n=1 Tax=Gandjariella thermophila TaxID=1931992 RepID=UPI0010F75562|nr:DUF2505 domain-containing protein [Gandjariella thermophila]